jgi:8-oxo-dGTP pyrophosphatase MutT (NUDIX family)
VQNLATEGTRPVKHRQAALCIFTRADAVLLTSIQDAEGHRYHRPVGGGIEPGETPEQAVRREVWEELGITLKAVPPPLPPIDHIWPWKLRDLHEKAWLFLVPAAEYPELADGQTPEIVEPDGERFPTVWRPFSGDLSALPPPCPAGLMDAVRAGLER